MRIRIDILVNLREEQIEAFRLLEGEPTEKNLSAFILANGVQALDDLEAEYHDILEAA